ncbi:hypothetical protein GQ43DRAFT_442380 [Delitschia confertaspora ATCC 74209]|uniref:CsbD-like domain-containing protein n=1 Tax=Delitschia confertaspora ATCC 74209 TaxID=1513339 RepID=A0A9P4JJR9_9PLEO|nr:hypothetical protein GQ43DRAFT_442380 [Delitschia confertaspora ATCC 74209]
MTTNKDNTSTLQSVIDSASSTVQSAIGSITGNPADKREADRKQATADAEHDLSHTAAKAGPFAVSSTGAVAQDDPDRTKGAWNQNVGALKEAAGGFIGAEGLRQDGIEQNRAGKGQEAQGQVSDLGKGLKDRIGGTVGSAAAGLVGDRSEQEKRQQQHDEGKTRQRGVEHDLQKEATHDQY